MHSKHALACLFLIAFLQPAYSDERIKSYHSEIDISADTSMQVTETITVNVEGKRIRRGIYRDFPTDYKDDYGNRIKVDFEVLRVTRNDQPEPWYIESRANGVRVYIGNANRLLAHDTYTYRISYRTTRQLGFFDEHDELYWNVNGNGWDFSIDQLSATISLPANVPTDALSIEGFVGFKGSRGTDYIASTSNRQMHIATNRRLSGGEGLTLVAKWPKGVVKAPTQTDQLVYLLQDNIGLLLSLLALFGSAVYLYVIWARLGKDPAPGVIFSHYEPPVGYSPASARYIIKRGYDDNVLSAAIVNLAVKGYLTITNESNYVLREKSSDQPLAAGEAALLKRLFRAGPRLSLEDSNYVVVAAAKKTHEQSLERDYKTTHFVQNAHRCWPSILVLILVVIAIASLGAFTLAAAIVIAINIIVHIVFAYLLDAPTKLGRQVMDKLEGFELYLNVAEKDDLNLKNPPGLTPELFERYLPYAIALGVEQAWAERFTTVFANLSATPETTYQPLWYSGTFNHAQLGNFASVVGQEFSGAISSSSSPPGSSSGSGGFSGGGGGFSGGGGGGGGGGGW